MRIENDLFIIRELHKLGEISDEQYIESLNLYLKMTWVILTGDPVFTPGLLFVLLNEARRYWIKLIFVLDFERKTLPLMRQILIKGGKVYVI